MTNPQLSYQNDPSLKSRFCAHVERHRQLDMLHQGSYGEAPDERGFPGPKWRGCAVACSLRSLDEIDGAVLKHTNNDHAGLAKRLGIPLVLACLEDQIFEGLPAEPAQLWPTRFAQAIPIGRDLSMVWPRLAHWLLVDEAQGVIRFANTDQTRDSIRAVAALFARHIAGDPPSADEWRSARYAAAAARYAAAADAAADAAAAAAAARYAARSDHYEALAAKLCELMAAA